MTTSKKNQAERNYELFKQPRWWDLRFDGRKRIFRGITEEEFQKLSYKKVFRVAKALFYLSEEKAIDVSRHIDRVAYYSIDIRRHKERVAILRRFANIPYEYQGEGWEDWKLYQRPTLNGTGYCAICPGERANNIYIEDPILVTLLKKRYNKHINNKNNNEI